MGIAVGSHNQSCCIRAGLACCTTSRYGRRSPARTPPNYRVVGRGRCKLWWSTGLGSCHCCLYMSDHYTRGYMGPGQSLVQKS
jgi:hypothetical protein